MGVSGLQSRNHCLNRCREENESLRANSGTLKWRNVDVGAGHYYITATFRDWLPLFNRAETREVVCEEITKAMRELGGSVTAFVLMPTHLHLLVYLPGTGLLHRFCMLWRGRSARRISGLLESQGEHAILRAITTSRGSRQHYSVWKEQVRSLPIVTDGKLQQIADYIHANPVRRGLADSPMDWEFPSFRSGGIGGRRQAPALRTAILADGQ